MLKLSILGLLLTFVVLFCLVFALKAEPVVSKADLSSIDSGTKETTIGDLTADALRASADVDIAFVPSSALHQESLPMLGLQTDQISNILVATTAPENAYVTLRLKGKQIEAALERSVSHLPQSYDGFLQVSGVHVTYSTSKPEGSRITSITLADGTALVPDSQYTAAMTQPLGRGGMGYWQIWNQSDIATTSDGSLAAALVTYVNSHQPLNIQIDGRLKSL